MRVRPPGSVLAAGLALLMPALAAAQDPVAPFIGRLVAEVRIELSGEPLRDSALDTLLIVKAGRPLSIAEVRETMDHFGRLARFESVRFLVSESPAGLVVTMALEPSLPIDRVVFAGTLGLPESDLQRRVRDLYGGLPPASANLRSIEQSVARALADEGYLTPQVTAVTERVPGDERSALVVGVQAGPRATIAAVRVDNQSPFTDQQVQDRTGAIVGGPYRPRAITSALAGLREDLTGLGYYLAFANVQVAESADRSSVDLEIIVGAGPRVRVEWAGDRRPGGDVDDLVPIRREGMADDDLLEDADVIIRDALRRDGYRDAVVFHTRETRGEELVITFDVARGRRYRLARVDLPADLHVGQDVARRVIGLEPDEPIDDSRVVQGLARLVLEYQRLGFYTVEAKPEYTEDPGRSTAGEAWLVLHPAIVEGPRGLVRAVSIERVDENPLVPEADLRAVMRSLPGQPYSLAWVYVDRIDLEALLHDRGFRAARVEALAPVFSEDGTAVDLIFRVTEGPQTIVSQITVVGNERVSEETILERIALRVGEPLGPAAINDSRRRLAELGISRAVFSEQPRPAEETRAHVILSVDEAPATTVGYGGGIEAGYRPQSAEGIINDVLEVAPRGFIELARRHIGGRDRTLSFFGRVSLKRATVREDEDTGGGGFGFIEYRTTVAYRERRAFDTDTELLFGLTSEQATRTNFNFLRRAINAEVLRRTTPTVSINGRYRLEFTKLFDELIPPEDQPAIDRLFPQVRLSAIGTGVVWDRRDSLVSPTRGTYVTADIETALRPLGSEVDYVKTFFQFLKLTPLSESRRFVLATRAQVGLARGGDRKVDEDVVDPISEEPVETVDDLPASERFYAGGGTTVRGFQTDRLGVPEILNDDGLSNGGNAVVVLNAEVRAGLGNLFGRRFSGVGFVDGGNVFRRVSDLDLGRIRGTTGFGVRWDSPLGPLRLDVGFKMNRLLINGRPERLWELHFSIGEAF